ncbi:MAG: alpha/beta hydrolase [Pseudomonadota bacterium]
MPYAEVNAAKLWYDVQGEGAPLFCIGGMGLVSNQYDFTTPILSKSCKVINYDIRGVGKSAPPPLLNYRDYSEQAEDVRAIMDTIGIKKAHIWAGACSHIGVKFAARYPDRTASLIFFPWFRPIPAVVHIFDAGVELCGGFGKIDYWATIIASAFTDPNFRKLMLEWEVPMLVKNLSCEAFKIHWGSMKHCDLTNEIPNIKVPTLMLMGTEGVAGNKTTQSEIKFVEYNIPGAEKVFIEGSGGTYYMIDNPEKTCAAILDWIKKHPLT